MLKVISRLLDYPTAELFAAVEDLVAVVEQTDELLPAQRAQLIQFIRSLTAKDLYDAQERYDLLFDRGRALSLLLFEHVHGESRDRGQAMVELMKVYNSKGFDVDAAKLPDYLPLYLEFLSTQEQDFACEWLGDICHLLTTLSERLRDRQCDYQILFDSLIELSGYEVDRATIAAGVREEKRDDTVEAIDRAWEDKQIRFDDPINDASGNNGLDHPALVANKPSIQQVPIKWQPFTQAVPKQSGEALGS